MLLIQKRSYLSVCSLDLCKDLWGLTTCGMFSIVLHLVLSTGQKFTHCGITQFDDTDPIFVTNRPFVSSVSMC